jgi:hypothetical protein
MAADIGVSAAHIDPLPGQIDVASAQCRALLIQRRDNGSLGATRWDA